MADKTSRQPTQALHVVMVDLGGEFQKSFAEQLHTFDIGLIVSRGSTHFAERVIGTLRRMIGERMVALKLPWNRVIEPVVERYNETVQVLCCYHDIARLGLGSSRNGVYHG